MPTIEKNYIRNLRLFAAVIVSILVFLLLGFLCWGVGTDAQGAIGLFILTPVFVLLIFCAIKLAKVSRAMLTSIKIAVLLPVTLFYISLVIPPANFFSNFVIKTVSKTVETKIGVSPYDWGKRTRRLHIAARNGDILTIEKEIKGGGDVNLENVYKETPIFFCAEAGQLETCKTLVKLGANVNQQKNSGWTVLQIAVSRNDLDMVRLFVESGADLNIKNYNENSTALHLAKKKGFSEIGDYLQNRGAVD